MITPEQHPSIRVRTKFITCERHAWLGAEPPQRRAEFFCEGGPAHEQGCQDGQCRLWPGTDLFEPSVCHGEMKLPWTVAMPDAAEFTASLPEPSLMAQVRSTLMARGELSADAIDDYLHADDDKEAQGVYEQFIAPAIDSLENAIQAVGRQTDN